MNTNKILYCNNANKYVNLSIYKNTLKSNILNEMKNPRKRSLSI